MCVCVCVCVGGGVWSRGLHFRRSTAGPVGPSAEECGAELIWIAARGCGQEETDACVGAGERHDTLDWNYEYMYKM